jgi:hypothetical protein
LCHKNFSISLCQYACTYFSFYLTDAADAEEDTECVNSLLLDIATLRTATDDFAESSGIGEGGFGGVYKVPVKAYFSSQNRFQFNK